MLGEILLEYLTPRCKNLCKNCPWYQIVKGEFTDPKTKLGSTIAHNPLNLLCIEFTDVDPSKMVRNIYWF